MKIIAQMFRKYCLVVGVLLAGTYAWAQRVWVYNATSAPVWVVVKKKGRAGVDSSVADTKQKVAPLSYLSDEGVNITDIYVCEDSNKALSQKEIEEKASKNSLHRSYSSDNPRYFVRKDNAKLKLDTTVSISSSNYPSWNNLVSAAEKRGSAQSNPWVGSSGSELIQIFKKISKDGFPLSSYDPRGIISERYDEKKAKTVLATIKDALKIEERIQGWTHFQGGVRLPNWLNLGNYVVLSGGTYTDDPKTCKPNLFLLKLENQSQSGTLKQLDTKSDPKNVVVKDFVSVQQGSKDASAPYWHPGGLGLCGRYLIVPVAKLKHDLKGTKIQIYDIKNPENATMIVELASPFNYAAVDMARLPNNLYLLAGLDGSRLDFYVSKSTNISDGFYSQPTVALPSNGMVEKDSQNISLITAGDGTLFMAMTNNTNSSSPLISGDDKLWVFKIDYDMAKIEAINKELAQGKTATISPFDAISTSKVVDMKLDCGGSWCNFRASGFVYPISDKKLEILGVYHWVVDGMIKMKVFHSK